MALTRYHVLSHSFHSNAASLMKQSLFKHVAKPSRTGKVPDERVVFFAVCWSGYVWMTFAWMRENSLHET